MDKRCWFLQTTDFWDIQEVEKLDETMGWYDIIMVICQNNEVHGVLYPVTAWYEPCHAGDAAVLSSILAFNRIETSDPICTR